MNSKEEHTNSEDTNLMNESLIEQQKDPDQKIKMVDITLQIIK